MVLQVAGLNLSGKQAEAAVGTKMVLLRNGVLSRLDMKHATLQSSAVRVQASQRRLAPRRAFVTLRAAARRVQSAQRRRVWRRLILATVRSFRRRVKALRIICCALRVVSVMSSPAVRSELRSRSAAALQLQSGCRGMRARTARRWLALEKTQYRSIRLLQKNWQRTPAHSLRALRSCHQP